MKIVSFNIRCDYGGDGINEFGNRKEHIKNAIEERKPDVIVFQEVTPTILAWLNENLPQYNVAGCGREADLSGEHMVIACKNDSVFILGLTTFWLSDTPLKPGTRFAKQSLCPRICCDALVRYNDKIMRIYFTHLDHESDEARKLGFNVIVKKLLSEKDGPFVLLGDFNVTPDALNLPSIAKEQGLSMTDITTEFGSTFHDFGRGEIPQKIDYIFVSDGLSCNNTAMWLDCHGGVYLSDHYPIEAELSFEG